MAKETLVLTGDKRLNRKLMKLRGPDAKKAIRKSTRPALKPVLQEAKNNVPVDSGALKKSLKIRSLPRSRTSIGARVTSGDTGKRAFSGEQYYGAFVEFGTKHQKGQKFLKRAADRKRKQAIRIYGEHIGRNIKELGKRG